MKSHKTKLEWTEDKRWRAKIDSLPGCDVVADTQDEALAALRKTAIKAKLRDIAKAAKYQFPTADIEDMLREIDQGRGLDSYPGIERMA